MQKKPILIASGILILALCAFLFIRSKYLVKPGKAEITTFLEKFNEDVNAGNPDSLLKYFDTKQKTKQLGRLLNLLCNKTGSNGEKPLFYVGLTAGQSEIKIINAEILEAKIPIQFTEKINSGNTKQTAISLRIRKVSAGVFKIIKIDARNFYKDYVAYENDVRPIDNTITYSPITLGAFKMAGQLKTKYDTVIWFAHVDQKTYYYVVKGKWDMDRDLSRYYKDSVVEPHYMGLVNPELKEIIPPQYDLIYNINGTFPGLVEVEKDSKKGFFDLDGKNAVPVAYDQILPVTNDEHLAVLRKGNDYYYLGKDYVVSDKADINIGDYLQKIKDLNTPFDLYKKAVAVVTEYNSRTNPGAIYITPSYLVDLNIISKFNDFKNPLRQGNYDEIHTNYEITPSENSAPSKDNWLMAAFHSIEDHFLGGRGDFYTRKNLIIADKKSNRLLTQEIATDYTPDEGNGDGLKGTCNINSIKMLGDSLIEVKAGAVLYIPLYDSTKEVSGGPFYHYLKIKDNKLIELPDERNFGFTKYVKMDDSYLDACYNILTGTGLYNTRRKSTINHVTPEMLRYMKNEIFASYRYQFKDKRWQEVFIDKESQYERGTDKLLSNNANINDSLTVIDKYNINFIDQKLKGMKAPAKVLAAK